MFEKEGKKSRENDNTRRTLMKSLGILREEVLTFFASIVGGNSGMAHQDSLLIFLAWSQ